MAHCLRTQIFFGLLKRFADTKSVDEAWQEFFRGSRLMNDIKSEFGEDNVRQCQAESLTRCLKYAESMSKSDDGLSPCSVCQERGANYYLTHGTTAHKCVCSVCAMKLALTTMSRSNPKPKCPLCMAEIELIVEAPDGAPIDAGTESSEPSCLCGQKDCHRNLVVSQRGYGHNKKPNELFPAFECHTCTLWILKLEKFSLLYEVWV